MGASPAFRGFYLAGGTALALQLGHRTSLDLDLFSERPWLPDTLLAALRAVGPTVVDREGDGTFVGAVGGVRVSLFRYPFLLVESPVAVTDGVPLAGLRDIAAMKLVAVGRRGSRKDFVDMFFLGRAGVDVGQALDALVQKMPGVEHNPVHIARSLAYFDGAEREPEPRMLVPFDWLEARAYCLAQSRDLLRRIIESG
jgi:Nucleotidyl transferase AbiEii toxin, Type IV TA system